MDINGVSATQKAGTNPPVRPQKEAEAQKPLDQSNSAQNGAKTGADKVEISDQSSVVVERFGVSGGQVQQNNGATDQNNTGAIQPQPGDRGKDSGQVQGNNQIQGGGQVAETVEKDSRVRRDYSLDQGNLVVKIIDTDANTVVREIPSEDARRIREAIAKFQDAGNSGNQTPDSQTSETQTSDGQTSETKGIDVTS